MLWTAILCSFEENCYYKQGSQSEARSNGISHLHDALHEGGHTSEAITLYINITCLHESKKLMQPIYTFLMAL